MRSHGFVPTFLATLAVSCAAALAASPATAEAVPGALIVFDGSGSMWGELGGREPSKFVAARDALKQVLDRARREARLGLVAFGHRRKADCQDIELVVPSEPGAAREVSAELETLSPRGKGPLALALRETAKVAADQSLRAIIVIHDGPDNCQQDTCLAAADIAKAHPGLAIHTVGIGLEPQIAQRHACIARSTGGKAYEAREPAALAQALEAAFQLARLMPGAEGQPEAAAPKPKPVTPELAQATGPPRVHLTAYLGPVDTPITTPVKWTLREAEGGKTVVEATAAELSHAMLPGTYDVEARLGLAAGQRTITVAPKGATAEKIVFDAGVVEIATTTAAGGPLAEEVVLSVVPMGPSPAKSSLSGERQWIGRQAKVELVLPSGRYVVRAALGLSREEEAITVTGGNLSKLDIAMQSGKIELSAAERAGGESLEGVSYSVAADDPGAPEGRREIARSLARSPSFTLPAGTYYVTARLGTMDAQDRIAVGAGAVAAKTLLLPVARLSLSASLKIDPPIADPAISYRVRRLDGEASTETARSASANPEFLLAPGRYKVEASAGAQTAMASQVVDLPAGGRKAIALSIEAGQLALKLGGASPPLDSFWEIRDAAERPIWRTTRAEPQGILAPGRYTVRFESRERRLETTVELAAGERKAIELNAE